MKYLLLKINTHNNSLYCIYSKEKIEIGEKYIVSYEEYRGEEIKKCYKVEYKDFIDE